MGCVDDIGDDGDNDVEDKSDDENDEDSVWDVLGIAALCRTADRVQRSLPLTVSQLTTTTLMSS